VAPSRSAAFAPPGFGEELAFLKTQAISLQSIPVTFDNDYQPALQDVPRKVAVFQVALPPPPSKPQSSSSSSRPSASATAQGIPIVIKSTKPALTFELTVHPTDTIADIKSKLANEHRRAPPADTQRLLLKGKVLADNKLLKEYPISDSTTITLMMKPGTTWTGEEKQESPIGAAPGDIVTAEPETFAQPAPTKLPPPATASRHGRSLSGQADMMPLPSLTLSPTPSLNEPGKDVKLELASELDLQPDPVRVRTPQAEAFHQVIVDAEFWQRLLTFLEGEFKTPDDARSAWEEFFLASKTHLTAHQIAKIRDVTGVVAMAGY